MTHERLWLIVIACCLAAVMWAYRIQVTVATWERTDRVLRQLQFSRLP